MNLFKKASLFALALFSFYGLADKAFAATIFTGPSCGLVDAVLSAETNSAIGGCVSGSGSFDTIVLTEDVTLSSAYSSTLNALPIITTHIKINGSGNSVTNDQSSSSNPFRVFEVWDGNLEISNLTFNNIAGQQGNITRGGLINISNGNLSLAYVRAYDFYSSVNGGFINAQNTPILIQNSIFQFGGGSQKGGVLFMEGGENLVIKNTEMKNNSSVEEGGAISVKGNVSVLVTGSLFKQNASDYAAAMSVGFLSDSKSLIIKDSEFEKNYSATGGAVSWGGWNGKVSISGTTFFDNKGFSDGAAFVNEDGVSTVSIINSTFSLNESFGNGGAILNRGEQIRLKVSHNSFIENYSNGNGGAFKSISPLDWVDSSLKNNIFYQNVGGDCNLETQVGFTMENNLSDDGTCGQVSATGVDMNLDFNGGPTRTHKLLQGSNAIDTATSIGCPKADQRGYARMLDGNDDGVNACDIGAYEYKKKGRPVNPVRPTLSNSSSVNPLPLAPKPSQEKVEVKKDSEKISEKSETKTKDQINTKTNSAKVLR